MSDFVVTVNGEEVGHGEEGLDAAILRMIDFARLVEEIEREVYGDPDEIEEEWYR